MAEKRMFSKTIIDSDMFLEMPISSQNLYFHLCMRADDDGFINNPKRIMKTVSAAEDDLKLLVAKQFLIPFDSGVVVIKHWKIHNYIRGDRYHQTVNIAEKNMLSESENKEYYIGIPHDIPMVDADKNRIDKNRIDKISIYIQNFNDFFIKYPRKQSKAKTEDYFIKNKIDNDLYEPIKQGLQKYLQYWKNEKTDKKFIPLPTTWLNQKRWLDEINIQEEKEQQMDNSDLEERYDRC